MRYQQLPGHTGLGLWTTKTLPSPISGIGQGNHMENMEKTTDSSCNPTKIKLLGTYIHHSLLVLDSRTCDLTLFCNKNGLHWSIPLSTNTPELCKYCKTGEEGSVQLTVPQQDRTCVLRISSTPLQPAKQIRKKRISDSHTNMCFLDHYLPACLL